MLIARTQDREFSAHHILLHASHRLIQAAESSEEGRFNNCLAAMTMTALAVEALINAVGKRIAPDWSTFVGLGAEYKVETLRALIGYQGDLTQPPWPTLREIKNFRDRIAHAKPEAVRSCEVVKANEALPIAPPLSKLEKQITLKAAKRMYEAVNQLKTLLHDHLPHDDRAGIFVDGWIGSESVIAAAPSRKGKLTPRT